MIRRSVLAVSLVVLGTEFLATGVGGAAVHPKVGPHQYFDGSVNGSTGVTSPAVIKVICPGPVGTTGHPLAGQVVEVNLAVAVLADSGYTGNNATSIGVFFGAPPPAAGPGQVNFTRYGVRKAIPTSLNLPCGGSGVVTFVPFPQSPPTSHAATVPVLFANIAA